MSFSMTKFETEFLKSSPRVRTPPPSARGMTSSRRGKKTPRTPRPVCDPVQVVVRLRPPTGEAVRYSVTRSSPSGEASSVMQLSVHAPPGGGTDNEMRTYEFASVLDTDTSNAAVVGEITPKILEQVRHGYNACVMLYGQTGSGKTHTANALIPSVIEAIFALVSEEESEGKLSCVLQLSCLQIYNNHVYNLLSSRAGDAGEPLSRPKGLLVQEPSVCVETAAAALSFIAEAQKRRVVAPHALNPRSSRSHTLCSLRITKMLGGVEVQSSKVTIADLAGSERVKKSGVVGDAMEEAIAINKSLSSLHSVIKAASSDSDLVPFRESLLTLYLASSLTNAYTVLIATIALEVTNFHELKSTLEFATTAKRAVVTRSRADYTAGDGASFEASQAKLQAEVEMLRQRVDFLRRDAELERERNNVLQSQLSNADSASTRLSMLQDHVSQMDRTFTLYQNLLRDREEQLQSLEKRRGLLDELREEMKMRQQDKDTALADLMQTVQTADGQGGDGEMFRRLSRISDAFLWIDGEYSAALEHTVVLEKTLRTVRSEMQSTSNTLIDAKSRVLNLERSNADLGSKLTNLQEQYEEALRDLDEASVTLARERNTRRIQTDAMALMSQAAARDDQFRELQAALDMQTSLSESMQEHIFSLETAFSTSEAQRVALQNEADNKDATLRTMWALLTPQQKGKVMSTPGPQQATEARSHELRQLQIQLRSKEREIQAMQNSVRERDSALEALREDREQLAIALESRNRDYEALARLEARAGERGDELEMQLEGLYGELDAHDARYRTCEQQLRVAQAECDRLGEEHRHAEQEIAELTQRLKRALDEVKHGEQDKDVLTARLRQAEEAQNVMALKFDAERNRLLELEQQIKARQSHSVEVGRRLNLVESRRRHLTTELQRHVHHGQVLHERLSKINPDAAKKKALRIVAHVDPTRPVSAPMPSVVDAVNRDTAVRQLRFEVSQVVRPSRGFAQGVAKSSDASERTSPPPGTQGRRPTPQIENTAPPSRKPPPSPRGNPRSIASAMVDRRRRQSSGGGSGGTSVTSPNRPHVPPLALRQVAT